MKYKLLAMSVVAVAVTVLLAQVTASLALQWAIKDIPPAPEYSVMSDSEALQGVLIGEAVEYPPCNVEGLEYISGWCIK